MSSEHDTYDRFENVASLLLGVSGVMSSQNAWAGPDHWKYRKSKSQSTNSLFSLLFLSFPCSVQFIAFDLVLIFSCRY